MKIENQRNGDKKMVENRETAIQKMYDLEIHLRIIKELLNQMELNISGKNLNNFVIDVVEDKVLNSLLDVRQYFENNEEMN